MDVIIAFFWLMWGIGWFCAQYWPEVLVLALGCVVISVCGAARDMRRVQAERAADVPPAWLEALAERHQNTFLEAGNGVTLGSPRSGSFLKRYRAEKDMECLLAELGWFDEEEIDEFRREP